MSETIHTNMNVANKSKMTETDLTRTTAAGRTPGGPPRSWMTDRDPAFQAGQRGRKRRGRANADSDPRCRICLLICLMREGACSLYLLKHLLLSSFETPDLGLGVSKSDAPKWAWLAHSEKPSLYSRLWDQQIWMFRRSAGGIGWAAALKPSHMAPIHSRHSAVSSLLRLLSLHEKPQRR